MAIEGTFNLDKATTSQSYGYKCWYNYNYGGNTMKISASDIRKITTTWSGELKNWKANAENDDNKYEITIYTCCCNADRGIYYYTTYDNHRITAVDMNRENLDTEALIRYVPVSQERIEFQN